MIRDAWDDDVPNIEELSIEVKNTNSANSIPIPNYGSNNSIGTGNEDRSISEKASVSANDTAVDVALLGGLENPRERMNILKFEDKIVRFLKNRREQQLSFEPLNSFHRRIVHRLAERFQLDHQVFDVPFEGQQFVSPGSNKGVLLSKSPLSRIPQVLLIDLPCPELGTVTRWEATSQASLNVQGNLGSVGTVIPVSEGARSPISQQKQKVTLMRRRGKQGTSSRPQSSNQNSENLTITDREKAYAEARARIFGQQAATTGEEKESTLESKPKKSSSQSCSTYASGPDDSKGFGAGRGRPADTDYLKKITGDKNMPPQPNSGTGFVLSVGAEPWDGPKTGGRIKAFSGQLDDACFSAYSTSPASKEESNQRLDGSDQESDGGSRRSTRKIVNVADWKDSRVIWRDANAERQDNDYQRGLDKYQRSFAPFRLMEVPVVGTSVMAPHIISPTGAVSTTVPGQFFQYAPSALLTTSAFPPGYPSSQQPIYGSYTAPVQVNALGIHGVPVSNFATPGTYYSVPVGSHPIYPEEYVYSQEVPSHQKDYPLYSNDNLQHPLPSVTAVVQNKSYETEFPPLS